MRNRILAALTCLVMLLCLIPFGATAAEEDGNHTSHDGWTQWTSFRTTELYIIFITNARGTRRVSNIFSVI